MGVPLVRNDLRNGEFGAPHREEAADTEMQVRGEGKNSDVQRSTVATLPQAAKQFAEAMIAKLTVKDIKPRQYAATQARSARGYRPTSAQNLALWLGTTRWTSSCSST